MARTVVSQEVLIEWMNSKLRQNEDFKGCRFTSVTRPEEVDADGCNWSSYWLQCSGVPVAECRPTANQIAEEAKKLFNLDEI